MRMSIPDRLCKERASLRDAAQRVCANMRVPPRTTDELLSSLPSELRSATAFLDALTGKWRYEYGLAYKDLVGGAVATGTDQCPEIEHLVMGVRAAMERLTPDDLGCMLRRLADEARHEEALAELAPLTRLPSGVTPKYESKDRAAQNASIDWMFTPRTGRPILMDVKSRKRELIRHLNQIIAGPVMRGSAVPVPTPDCTRLFDGIPEKFVPRSPDDMLQGAWIHERILQDRHSLHRAFSSLDRRKVHFAIFAGWGSSAYILARRSSDKSLLHAFFDLVESDTFVA